MFKKKFILLALVVLALSLTACTSDSDPKTPSVENPPVEEDSARKEVEEEEVEEWNVQDSNNSYANGKLSPIDAFDIYIEKYPDSKVRKIELERNNDIYEYEVEGFDDEKEYELKIDSETGDILDEDVDSLDDSHGYIELNREQIEKIGDIVVEALIEAGEDAALSEWTLDTKDGLAQIEIEIDREDQDDIENTYDIETGKLIKSDD